MGTWAVVRNREDRKLGFFSLNFEKLGIIETSLDELIPSKNAGWTNYPKGVMWAFEKRGYELTHGMDILIYGNIPNGSGLSSSASLEVLTGLMLKDTFGFEDLSMIDLALIGQYSENNFNGCNCGIMDQFASAMGKKDHAIFLIKFHIKVMQKFFLFFVKKLLTKSDSPLNMERTDLSAVFACFFKDMIPGAAI